LFAIGIKIEGEEEKIEDKKGDENIENIFFFKIAPEPGIKPGCQKNSGEHSPNFNEWNNLGARILCCQNNGIFKVAEHAVTHTEEKQQKQH
jgi:hypothetical protein